MDKDLLYRFFEGHASLEDMKVVKEWADASEVYTASAGVPAQTVQDAIENVQKQVRDASVGKLPSGCVDGDKLAQDVRNRLTAIEHAAESETNARTAADTDLQSDMNTVKTTLTVKTACHFGTYTGDGTEKRTITLGSVSYTHLCLHRSRRTAVPVQAD